MLNRIVQLSAGALVVAACAAPAASAITNGVADAGRHPWVGALVSHDVDTGDRYLVCSGSLVSPTVFLTAAHCLQDEPSDLDVSFDAFVGAPDVGPGVTLHHGQAYADPQWTGDTTGPGDTHDLAVVVLDQPVQGIAPAHVARVGTLSRLRRSARKLRWGVTGYGREGHTDDGFFGGGGRRTGFGRWLGLSPGVFRLDQSRPDEAGTCNGDSGGPITMSASKTIVGVATDGDPFCQEYGINARLDTRAAHAFIDPYLAAKAPQGGPAKPGKPDTPAKPDKPEKPDKPHGH